MHTTNQLMIFAFKILYLLSLVKISILEAILEARKKDFSSAKTKMEHAKKFLTDAKRIDFKIVQNETKNELIKAPYVLMRAKSELSCSFDLLLIAKELLKIYKDNI